MKIQDEKHKELVENTIAKMVKQKYIDQYMLCMASMDEKYIEYAINCGTKDRGWEKRCINLTDVSDTYLSETVTRFLLDIIGSDKRCVMSWTVVFRKVHDCFEIAPVAAKKDLSTFVIWLDEQAPHEMGSKCLHVFSDYLHRNGSKAMRFDYDIWCFDDFDISPDRKDNARNCRRVSFQNVNIQENKVLLKLYIQYLIEMTDTAVRTMSSKVSAITTALNIVQKPYTSWTKEDAGAMLMALQLREQKSKTIQNRYVYLGEFTKWLIGHDYMADNPLKSYRALVKPAKYDYKCTAPSDYVVDQIFEILSVDSELSLTVAFLIMYCTGCRVSEMILMKKNCLEDCGSYKNTKGEDGRYFLRYHSQKMKKDCQNSICEELYTLIGIYRTSLSSDSDWLFPSPINTHNHVSIKMFLAKLRQVFVNGNILNSDGTQYVYEPHSFRHLMAVRMRKAGIPVQFIQEQLHHASPEMTMAYLEYIDKENIKKMKSFVDIEGKSVFFDPDIEVTDDDCFIQLMKKRMNEQALPNGICARPIKLGQCTHGNDCLNCSEFRTSLAYLDTLNKQLARTKELIRLAKQNDWQPQLKTNERIEGRLELIISSLKKAQNRKDENTNHDDNGKEQKHRRYDRI